MNHQLTRKVLSLSNVNLANLSFLRNVGVKPPHTVIMKRRVNIAFCL